VSAEVLKVTNTDFFAFPSQWQSVPMDRDRKAKQQGVLKTRHPGLKKSLGVPPPTIKWKLAALQQPL
jgi:hypothetical protein